MDTRTGDLIDAEQFRRLFKEDKEIKYFKVVETKNLTPRAIARMKVGRNDPCPCGSGHKFKKCCLNSIK